MGLIEGTGSFARFSIDGTVPQDYMEVFPQRIARNAFRDLDENSLEERSVGWVNIMDLLDAGFPGMEYLKEPYLAMSWRVDTRKVPKKALKRYCREAENRIRKQESVILLK